MPGGLGSFLLFVNNLNGAKQAPVGGGGEGFDLPDVHRAPLSLATSIAAAPALLAIELAPTTTASVASLSAAKAVALILGHHEGLLGYAISADISEHYGLPSKHRPEPPHAPRATRTDAQGAGESAALAPASPTVSSATVARGGAAEAFATQARAVSAVSVTPLAVQKYGPPRDAARAALQQARKDRIAWRLSERKKGRLR
jgi:hypothetical protein